MILAAGDSTGEDTFWVQMLVLVILAALLGIVGLIKTRAKRFKGREGYYPEGARSPHGWGSRQIGTLKEFKDRLLGTSLKTAQSKGGIKGAVFDFGGSNTGGREKIGDEPAKKKERYLAGGMEMLKLNFLLGVIEKTKGDNKDDVMMRNLSFNELLRRGQVDAADSNALKVYARNESNLYSKDIQCAAMKELAERSGLRSG